ncbi:hypothetical protein [Streptomyces turgidiscabies]|uniref:Uncharacterized protein n=1 Tax=Streptomyces turgidiscabies TaxID=85558 RepID=A0ABU0RMP7_9ACTN|nr:hypothetical protein [Streptomyces turgidiscabies]MDQ0933239.1 hypothetical protein [Streptomyces turgidiscabies]
MIVAAILLPPGLMCVMLALGRYEEWLLKERAHPARHGHRRRHLSLVPRAGTQAEQNGSESRLRITDAA